MKLALPLLRIFLAASLSACERAVDWYAERELGRADESMLNDGGLHVVFCGTGAPLADPNRMGPCTAIVGGGEFLLVDAGPGSWRNTDLAGIPPGALSGVLLTHFHSDHIGELGEAAMQSWVGGRPKPLAVYGPPGVERVVAGFQEAYALDAGYRIAHHGKKHLPPDGAKMEAHAVELPSPREAALVFERGGFKVLAFAVDHPPIEPAYGYRIEFNGRSVVVSGDTRKSENLVRHAKGADLLIHEALSPEMFERGPRLLFERGNARLSEMAADVPEYHASPVDAAEVASSAGVRHLVLTHVIPPIPNFFVARKLFLKGAKEAFDDEITLAYDRLRIDLAGIN